MTIHTEVECDGCGEKVKPPENARWGIAFGIGADGVSTDAFDAHLCFECRQDFKRWLAARRKAADAERSARKN